MEFENVYILNCCEEVIPHANATDVEEERRLFDVAITRAINNLNIYAPKTLRGRFIDTSPFIKELEFKGEPEEKSKLNKGDKIFHRSHGEGEIVSLKDDVVEIEFGDGVKRKFSLSILFLNRRIEMNE